MPAIEVEGVAKSFRIPGVRRDTVREHLLGLLRPRSAELLRVLDGVSFTVKSGETLGIVGESGCGKSTLARCIMRLFDMTDGQIIFDGRDITKLSRTNMRPICPAPITTTVSPG